MRVENAHWWWVGAHDCSKNGDMNVGWKRARLDFASIPTSRSFMEAEFSAFILGLKHAAVLSECLFFGYECSVKGAGAIY